MNQLLDVNNSNLKHEITIKNVDEKFADPKAIRSLVALMDQHAVNGGAACHWGGPSAIAEFISSLHSIMFKNTDWYNHFNFVNDIGHAENALYAIKALYQYGDLTFDNLKTFRQFDSKLTGHGESHLYPEGVLLSNGPLGSSVPQAQGLAMSDKKLGNKRITVSLLSDGGAMEGEAKEAISAIPGLHQKNLINPFLLVISDNETKLSGRTKDAFKMTPTFDSLSTLGWKVIKAEEGNNLEKTYHALKQSLESANNTPTVLWLKTIKGYGVKSTEESASGGHGFPLKKNDGKITSFIDEIWNNETPEVFKNWANSLNENTENSSSGPKKEKMQVGVSKAFSELKNEGLPIISLSSDLQGSTGMKPFHADFPQDSVDLGIAESNMVSVAAGYSKNGFIPVVDTFAAFGVTKGNLPLIKASLSNCPMICIFSHTGFQDAADGASHQTLTYFSALSSIPNVEIIAPSNSDDTYRLIKHFTKKQFEDKKKNHAKSYVFFIGRETFEPNHGVADSNILDDQVLINGSDGVIVATGPLVHEAKKACEILKKNNKNYTLVNHRHLNNVNASFYKNLLDENKGKLITLEDHQIKNGMGSFLTHQLNLSCAGSIKSVSSYGINGVFGQSAYTAVELYKKHGLDSESIAENLK